MMKLLTGITLGILFLVNVCTATAYHFIMPRRIQPTLTPTPRVTVTPTPVVSGSTKPVIVIVPGYGFNLTPDSYSYIISDLTNKGYTVVKYYPTYTDISNYSNLVNVWSNGVISLIGTRRAIVIGHSVGGAVAVHVCATNNHCVGSVNLDGGPAQYEKIPVANLYLQGEVGNYCDQGCIDGRNLATTITTDSKGTKVFLVGLKHMNFTDYALHQSNYPDIVAQGYFGSIDPQTGLNEIDSNIDTFVSKI